MLHLFSNWTLPDAGKTIGFDKNRDKKRYQRILSWYSSRRFAFSFPRQPDWFWNKIGILNLNQNYRMNIMPKIYCNL